MSLRFRFFKFSCVTSPPPNDSNRKPIYFNYLSNFAKDIPAKNVSFSSSVNDYHTWSCFKSNFFSDLSLLNSSLDESRFSWHSWYLLSVTCNLFSVSRIVSRLFCVVSNCADKLFIPCSEEENTNKTHKIFYEGLAYIPV